MTDMDALVEKACVSHYGKRIWNGTNTIHSIERAQARHRYRTALLAVGLPALIERVEAAEALEQRIGSLAMLFESWGWCETHGSKELAPRVRALLEDTP